MSEAIEAFKGRLSDARIETNELAKWLDERSHEERVACVRATTRAEQRRLWEASDGFAPVRLAELVPASVPAGDTVRHYGKNTLPLFTHFEKRFARADDVDPASPSELFGFNFQTMSPVTGPGYFVAVEDPHRDEVLIDYRRLPKAHPADWPEIRSNERGLSRFVYGFMIDTLRRVSTHVTIGSAARKGKDMGSWFLLCAEP